MNHSGRPSLKPNPDEHRTVLVLIVSGLCGWGLLVPQQHRLIHITPAAAPLVLGLNSTAVSIGVSMSGLIGGAAITGLDRHALGRVGAPFIALALLVAEWAHRRIARPAPHPAEAVATAVKAR